MPVRGRLRNVNNAFRGFSRELGEVVQNETNETAEQLLENLRNATPVDTGNARDSWFLERATPNLIREVQGVIYNTTEYIDELNEGSSRQAPARFIERAALQLFEPDGVIVERSNRRA